MVNNIFFIKVFIMNRKVLLISEDTIKEQSSVSNNLFGKNIAPSIVYAQEMGLIPIIGECLYDKLCGLVEDGSITDILFTAYKDLLDNYIQPYLLNKTICEIIPSVNYKIANLGAIVSNDEHVVNLSQKDIDLLITTYQERADFYTKRLQDFIKNNKQAFPEIVCNCGNMQPNLDSSENSVGLWLGGSRGKKVSSENKCGCSSSEVVCGDYQDGFNDGVEFQKRKLSIVEFDENGRYIREDGYNEVTVNVQPKTTSLTVTDNGEYLPTGFDGFNSVTVNVPTGHSDEELYEQYLSGYTNGIDEGFLEGYTSGSTDGFNSGYTSGETHQKSLLSALTITQNGDYAREDGYSAITVNVSGHSATLTTTAVTANGEYAAPQGYDGFSSFEVNVPNTGYTQQDLDNAYASGETHQKSLMTSTSVTENGVYTRINGFSAVTVNVPQTGISGTEIAINSSIQLNEYGTYYFNYTSATSIDSMTINFGEEPTGETYYVFNYKTHNNSTLEPGSLNNWNGYLISNTYSNGIGTYVFKVFDDNKLRIPLSAFKLKTQLKEMWLPADTRGEIEWNAFNSSGLESIYIPDDITTIAHEAFLRTNLITVDIPSSVNKIEYKAFYECSGLTSVTVRALVPPTVTITGVAWDGFSRTNDCPIYVPAQSVNAYKTAFGWSDYAERIQPIP